VKVIVYLMLLIAIANASYALTPANTPTISADSSSQIKDKPLKLGIILFPGFDQLDVTGPLEIFNAFPNTKIYFISNNLKPVTSNIDSIKIKPDSTFLTAPQLDVLFVPGGGGVIKALENDKEMLSFINKETPQLKYLSSVCTGALILGRSGELKGYQATTHWLTKKYLPDFGAIPVNQRVVVDRNRVTGAGVTSGFDVALQLGDLLFGKSFVEQQELITEYFEHKTLYNTTLETASNEAKEALETRIAPMIKERNAFFAENGKV
jgi:cyclohexyl-isocyanide hydratase